VDGANAFSNMAQALVIKFKSVRAANETRGIIDGLNIVMRASVDTSNEVKLEQSSDEIKDWIDDSNEARNKQYQEKVRQVDSNIQLRIHNRLRSIYQRSNMASRLSGQTSIFGSVFLLIQILLGIEGQKKLQKCTILS